MRLRIAECGMRIGLVVATLLGSGCASIMCGDDKTVNISSQPPGARVEIIDAKGKTIIDTVTPANVTLKRGRGYFTWGGYTAAFTKPGYRELRAPIKQGFETGWYFVGNLLFSWEIGWFIVDPLTGAMWDIKDLNVTLQADPDWKEPAQEPGGQRKSKTTYRMKKDASGNFLKDAKGNWILEEVRLENTP
jgi:hypothetical protein